MSAAEKRPPTPEIEPLWDARDVAKYFGVHIDVVREWVRTGHLGIARRVGPKQRIIRFIPSEVEAWAKAR